MIGRLLGEGVVVPALVTLVLLGVLILLDGLLDVLFMLVVAIGTALILVLFLALNERYGWIPVPMHVHDSVREGPEDRP